MSIADGLDALEESDRQRKEEERVADEAAKRVDFQLTYARSKRPRIFDHDELQGDAIDNAFTGNDVHGNPRSAKSPGSWTIGDRPLRDEDNTVPWWMNTFCEAAVQEGIHEVLEWLQVDGKVWLNPHGIHEQEIMDAVHDLFKRLKDMRDEGFALEQRDA